VSGEDDLIWDKAYITIILKLTDENKVSIVAALSLFCLVVVLKDVLHVKLADIVYSIILCSCCYWLFGFFAHAEGEKARKHPSGANQMLATAKQGVVPIS
jgi:hypothetical protein